MDRILDSRNMISLSKTVWIHGVALQSQDLLSVKIVEVGKLKILAFINIERYQECSLNVNFCLLCPYSRFSFYFLILTV